MDETKPRVRSAVSDYWEESLSEAAEECGLQITEGQLQHMADSARSLHENHGMAFYTPTQDPRDAYIKRLQGLLESERRKVTCDYCKGTGRLQTYGPHHMSDSECCKCYGQGRK